MGSEKEQLVEFLMGNCQGCPYCGPNSVDIELRNKRDLEEGGLEERTYYCRFCEREWDEFYVRSGVKLDSGVETWVP